MKNEKDMEREKNIFIIIIDEDEKD